jgi:hypothetical protein
MGWRIKLLPCAIAMTVFIGPSGAESNLTDFAGIWVLKYQNLNLLALSLNFDNGKISGSLARPKHFGFDADGDFTQITAEHDEAMVLDAALSGGRLELSIKNGEERDRFAMTLIDQDHALLRFMDVLVPPWRLVRAHNPEDARLASDWSEQKPRTKEIAALQAELKRMADEDQAVRLTNSVSEKRMQAVDRANRPKLLRIYSKFGWPKKSIFGKDAAGRFWLLVQHQDLSLQSKLLPEMQRAVAEGEASQRNFVYLYDRVMKGEGKPQHWGTQTSCVNGKAVLDHVDDPVALDERRRELYLQPVAEYVETLHASCRNFVHDLPARNNSGHPH